MGDIKLKDIVINVNAAEFDLMAQSLIRANEHSAELAAQLERMAKMGSEWVLSFHAIKTELAAAHRVLRGIAKNPDNMENHLRASEYLKKA
jgi:hypothetical protein